MWKTSAIVLVTLFALGILVPKLTVRDLVLVDESLKQCAILAVNNQYDNGNLFERAALYLGKSRVIKTDTNSVEMESFTLFRIPIGMLRGLPEIKTITTCDFASSPERLPAVERTPQLLSDGVLVQGLGKFHDVPVENGVKTYSSDMVGVSFNYPSDYLLFDVKGEGVGGAEYYMIIITPETQVREAIASVYGREWPPSIRTIFYREPNLSVSLEQWVRMKSPSNFDSSDPAQDGTLTPMVVAGIPALKYYVRGLYDSEYVAFIYGEWVVLAASDERGADTVKDFQTVLSSIQFKNHAQ